MANQEMESANEKKEYRFNKFPENIRQMGEQPGKNRVYIEDYVVTYMHQIFRRKQEEAIVVFAGQRGEGKARDTSFIYGAIDVELDVLAGNRAFTEDTWNEIYDRICESFPGAQVLGWGCGVSMWNSQIEKKVHEIQQKHFSQEEKILFLEDLSEKEEKIFHWNNGKLKSLSGYVIYYDKNPLMQEYMLRGQPKESFEAEYHDEVTTNVREVIHRNEEKEEGKKLVYYGIGAAMVLLAILGANLLLQSSKKIDSLEKTLETLSDAAVSATVLPGATPQEMITASPEPTEKASPQATNLVTASPERADTDAALPEEHASVLDPVQNSKPAQTVPPVIKDTPAPTQRAAGPTPAASSGKKGSDTVKKKESSSNNKSREASALWGVTQSYIVRSGDTLSQIVWRQYHSMQYMEMIKKANHITNENEIQVGQRIILPGYGKE